MKIEMQRADSSAGIASVPWDLCIVGSPIDKRGVAAVSFAEGHSKNSLQCSYEARTFEFVFDGKAYGADEADVACDQIAGSRVMLEATTLGFSEIYLICRAMRNAGATDVTLLYVEPRDYNAPLFNDLMHRRDFELSDEVPGYIPIPGATILLQDTVRQRGIFLLGYEERRLDRALEDHPIDGEQCAVLFGVPAYRAGWEMNAFANNLRVLRDRSLGGGVLFGGAQNPLAAYDAIATVHSGCGQADEFFVAPIGTKPHGIGAALYVAANPGVGILYDHPKRKQGRASEAAAWHLFEAWF